MLLKKIMRASWKIKYSIFVAFLFPLIARLNFYFIGLDSDLRRFVVPVLIGGISGFLIGLMKDRWIRINSTLDELVHLKTEELSNKISELENANKEILEISRTDSLTKVANRRYFYERTSEAISLINRQSDNLSLIITDIDNFKNVNDTFGHEAGDDVLVGFAALLRKNSRKEDLVARFGGEEFIILLPFTDIDGAFIKSERIRKSFEEMSFLNGQLSVTASFGVAQLKDGEKISDLIKRADEALYTAKSSGRNCTLSG